MLYLTKLVPSTHALLFSFQVDTCVVNRLPCNSNGDWLKISVRNQSHFTWLIFINTLPISQQQLQKKIVHKLHSYVFGSLVVLSEPTGVHRVGTKSISMNSTTRYLGDDDCVLDLDTGKHRVLLVRPYINLQGLVMAAPDLCWCEHAWQHMEGFGAGGALLLF